MIVEPCVPPCPYADLIEKYKPHNQPNLICARCNPRRHRETVNGLRYWANAVLQNMTFSMPVTVECDLCGAETARLGDRFCARCGARADGETAQRYTSYQLAEVERMTRNGEWTRERKQKARSSPPPAVAQPQQLSLLGAPERANPRRTRSSR